MFKKFRIYALIVASVLVCSNISVMAGDITCWFPPSWKAKPQKAKAITMALSEKSGLTINPRIAKSYPQIVASFTEKEEVLVYVGSFVQAIINRRDIGIPLVQAQNGKEMYGSWMVLPKDGDPAKILSEHAENVAYCMGASSGESGAKAATKGKAQFATKNHGASANAVKVGKASAGFVKSWWWKANGDKYPTLKAHQIPGVSDEKNADNVLTASKGIAEEDRKKIKEAAISSKDTFGAVEMAPFDVNNIKFSLELMEKGKIDPMTYSWE